MQIISLAQSENEITADILKNTDLENISPPAMEGLDEMISTGGRSPIKKGGRFKWHIDSSTDGVSSVVQYIHHDAVTIVVCGVR